MGGLIHWDVLITHMIAFVIVVLVLKKFAWGPILTVIDERREKIQGDIKNAEALEEQAQQRRSEYEAKLREIEAEARERINAAVDEGQKAAEAIRVQAREESRAIIEQGKRNVELELKKAQTVLQEQAVELVIQTSERLLKEKLDDEAHRRLVMDFISQAAARNN